MFTSTQYFFLLLSTGFLLGWLIGAAFERMNSRKMFDRIDHSAKELFNASIREANNLARENEIEFDEEKFVSKIARRSGMKIDKIEETE